MSYTFGGLLFVEALSRPDLLAPAVKDLLLSWAGITPVSAILVAEIDPEYSDTDAFCDRFQIPANQTANCLIVAGRRGDSVTPAACLVPAHARADINGSIRRQLGARQASLASREFAVEESGMEYGSITVVGLPGSWQLLVDQSLIEIPRLLIGGGLRKSKLLIPGAALTELPGAVVMGLVK